MKPAAQLRVFALRVAASVRAACPVCVTVKGFARLWGLLRTAAAAALALALVELADASTVERDTARGSSAADLTGLRARNARRRLLGGEVVVERRLVHAVALLDGALLAALLLVFDDNGREDVV